MIPVPLKTDFEWDNTEHAIEYTNVEAPYIEQYISITGISEAQQVGEYELVLSLKQSGNNRLEWQDGTTDDKRITWKISKKRVPIPSAKNTVFVYDGEEHEVLFNDLDTAFVNVSMVPRKDIGAYNCSLSLIDVNNTTWYDGTSTPKIITWQIIDVSGGDKFDYLIGQEVNFGHMLAKNYIPYRTTFVKRIDVKWIVAEKLDDNVYALQSEGVGTWGFHPTYKYNTSKNYAYRNIAPLADVERSESGGTYDTYLNISSLYAGIKWAEADGGRKDGVDTQNLDDIGKYTKDADKDGLYLVSKYDKCNSLKDTAKGKYAATIEQCCTDEMVHGNFYYYGLVKMMQNCERFGIQQCSDTRTNYAWLGDAHDNSSSYSNVFGYSCYNKSLDKKSQSLISYKENNTNTGVIYAPAFNLDVTKVDIVNKNGELCVVPKGMYIGAEYEMGGYDWICAEELEEGKVYAMQSEGMVAKSDISFSDYSTNKGYVDISGMYPELNDWYINQDWKSVEGSGGRTDFIIFTDNSLDFGEAGKYGKYKSTNQQDGLYLVLIKDIGMETILKQNSDETMYVGQIVPKGSELTAYYYGIHCGMEETDDTANGSPTCALIGNFSADSIYRIHSYKSNGSWVRPVGQANQRKEAIAPAFNLDITKVNIKDGVITK